MWQGCEGGRRADLARDRPPVVPRRLGELQHARGLSTRRAAPHSRSRTLRSHAPQALNSRLSEAHAVVACSSRRLLPLRRSLWVDIDLFPLVGTWRFTQDVSAMQGLECCRRARRAHPPSDKSCKAPRRSQSATGGQHERTIGWWLASKVKQEGTVRRTASKRSSAETVVV